MSDLRTPNGGRGWPLARSVQGRLSIQFGDEDEASSAPRTSAKETPAGSRRWATKPEARSSVFHPLAYRGVVADWPVEWRERWGKRANALEDNGLSWRDAETQAFVETWNVFRRRQASKDRQSSSAKAERD